MCDIPPFLLHVGRHDIIAASKMLSGAEKIWGLAGIMCFLHFL